MQCNFKPDVYVFSILLTFGTFALTYGLNIFRKTAYLSSTVSYTVLTVLQQFSLQPICLLKRKKILFLLQLRNSISDFCVLIAIIVMTGLSRYVGLDVPVLDIPASFRVKICFILCYYSAVFKNG